MSALLVILVPLVLALFAMYMERLEAAVLHQDPPETNAEVSTDPTEG